MSKVHHVVSEHAYFTQLHIVGVDLFRYICETKMDSLWFWLIKLSLQFDLIIVISLGLVLVLILIRVCNLSRAIGVEI